MKCTNNFLLRLEEKSKTMKKIVEEYGHAEWEKEV